MAGPAFTRESAADEARRELSRGIYRDAGPSWPEQVMNWLGDRIADLWISVTSPSGRGLGVTAVLVVIAAVGVAVRLRLGPVRRTERTASAPLELSSPLSAAALRTEADRLAETGAFAEALRSRLRAIVRMLEEAGTVEPRAGRTAGELVAEVGQLDPHRVPPLAAAVGVFSEVWYGGRDACAASYRLVVEADEALAGLRSPAPVGRQTRAFTVPA